MKFDPCPFCGETPLTKLKDVALINDEELNGQTNYFLTFSVVIYCPKCLTKKPRRNIMAIGKSRFILTDINVAPFKMSDGLAEAAAAWNERCGNEP